LLEAVEAAEQPLVMPEEAARAVCLPASYHWQHQQVSQLAPVEVQEPLVVQVKMAKILYFRQLRQLAAAAAVVTMFLLQTKLDLAGQEEALAKMTPALQLQEAQGPRGKATRVEIDIYHQL
jgi:hypothetical protein